VKNSFVYQVIPTIPSQVESSSTIGKITTPEDYFHLAKQAMVENHYDESEDFLIISIKSRFIQTVNG
jgi:hypothetical protein